jgi:hypothetical protein
VKIESPAFTVADLEHYSDELTDHERQVLADRLELASERLAELGRRTGLEREGGGDGWSPTEVLADHRRTVEYLRSADAAAMRRECVVDGGRAVMRAQDIAREALIGHLEIHVDQLERALAG